jgi:hypothetical protein
VAFECHHFPNLRFARAFHKIPRDPVNLHGGRIVSIRPAFGDRVRLRAISDRHKVQELRPPGLPAVFVRNCRRSHNGLVAAAPARQFQSSWIFARAKQPRLFSELDSIAASLGEPLPREVYLIADVNAWVGGGEGRLYWDRQPACHGTWSTLAFNSHRLAV